MPLGRATCPLRLRLSAFEPRGLCVPSRFSLRRKLFPRVPQVKKELGGSLTPGPQVSCQPAPLPPHPAQKPGGRRVAGGAGLRGRGPLCSPGPYMRGQAEGAERRGRDLANVRPAGRLRRSPDAPRGQSDRPVDRVTAERSSRTQRVLAGGLWLLPASRSVSGAGVDTCITCPQTLNRSHPHTPCL